MTRFHFPTFPVWLCVSLFFLLLFTGIQCNITSQNTLSPESLNTETASAEISIHLASIGTLAKQKTIDLQRLILTLASPGEDTIRDTTSLSGTGGTDVHTTIGNLSAPKTWSLTAVTYDLMDSCIHAGTTAFSTVPADTTDVSLTLNARFSMLRVSFNGIPDSAVWLTVAVNGEAFTAESTFTAGSLDTVVLSYDYLAASESGISHTLTLQAEGSYYGTDTVLYSVDTGFTVVSGEDRVHVVTCKWVGPDATVINLTWGLVAFYPFNGNADDESGNGHDGTIFGPTLADDRFGNSNGTYRFNGTSDYIEIPDHIDFDPSSISLALWINPDTVYERGNFIITKHISETNNDGSWWLARFRDSTMNFQATPTFQSVTPFSPDTPNRQWSFIAFTYNDTTTTVRL